eukprot:1046553-Rhodomonas_salina.1
MLGDRGRHALSPAGVMQGNEDDEPESVRRYRQFLAGSTKKSAGEAEEGRSIFISNAPSMHMHDWLNTDPGRSGR